MLSRNILNGMQYLETGPMSIYCQMSQEHPAINGQCCSKKYGKTHVEFLHAYACVWLVKQKPLEGYADVHIGMMCFCVQPCELSYCVHGLGMSPKCSQAMEKCTLL